MLYGLIFMLVAFMLISLVRSQETLLDLTEDQIRGAVAALTEVNLLEIITNAGLQNR